MAGFMNLEGIKGEATDQDHKDWSLIETMDAAIMRSIPDGSKDHQRTRGETSLGDISVTRLLDKSSVKIEEACATGKFFAEVEVHFTTDVKGKSEPYLKYLLKDVIITSYSFSGNSQGNPLPTEHVTLAYSEVEWTYVQIDPKTGDPKGQVPGKYTPGANQGS